jgi:hypothetical protein
MKMNFIPLFFLILVLNISMAFGDSPCTQPDASGCDYCMDNAVYDRANHNELRFQIDGHFYNPCGEEPLLFAIRAKAIAYCRQSVRAVTGDRVSNPSQRYRRYQFACGYKVQFNPRTK